MLIASIAQRPNFLKSLALSASGKTYMCISPSILTKWAPRRYASPESSMLCQCISLCIEILLFHFVLDFIVSVTTTVPQSVGGQILANSTSNSVGSAQVPSFLKAFSAHSFLISNIIFIIDLALQPSFRRVFSENTSSIPLPYKQGIHPKGGLAPC